MTKRYEFVCLFKVQWRSSVARRYYNHPTPPQEKASCWFSIHLSRLFIIFSLVGLIPLTRLLSPYPIWLIFGSIMRQWFWFCFINSQPPYASIWTVELSHPTRDSTSMVCLIATRKRSSCVRANVSFHCSKRSGLIWRKERMPKLRLTAPPNQFWQVGKPIKNITVTIVQHFPTACQVPMAVC